MHRPFQRQSVCQLIDLGNNDLHNQGKHPQFADHEFGEQEFQHLLGRFGRLTFEASVYELLCFAHKRTIAVVHTLSIHKPLDTTGVSGLGCPLPSSYLGQRKGVQMDTVVIIGSLMGILGVIVAVLRYDSSPLDEAIKEAQQWDSKQKRIKQALERK